MKSKYHHNSLQNWKRSKTVEKNSHRNPFYFFIFYTVSTFTSTVFLIVLITFQGDSGGPMTCIDSNGARVLTGTTSGGSGKLRHKHRRLLRQSFLLLPMDPG